VRRRSPSSSGSPPSIGHPLLVIFYSEDALVSPASAKLFEMVPGAKVEIIDGSGHSPMVETPTKTLGLIIGFLTNWQ
jgi:pimeloyl-ACP methyl ester carboxylesterase